MQHSQMDITADWSNLPGELWPLIGKKIKLHVEFLRFRGVCPSWRSSLPPPFLPSPPSKFPLPHSSDGSPSSYLSHATLYLLRQPATSSLSSFTGALLVKVEEDCDRMFLRHPITSNHVSSEGFNLMEYDMIELGKSDYLRYIHGSGSFSGLKKVINVTPSEADCCAIMVISDVGNLGYARDGDIEVRWFSRKDCVFDDVVVYKGQTYVVDTAGSVFRVATSSGLMTKISSKVVGSLGGRKHLVESCGELYMVDRYFDQEQRSQEVESDLGIIGRRGRNRRSRPFCKLKAADFKVYKLQWSEEDEDLGRLVEVDRLDDDQVMFLANDCSFAISAKWLAGSKGNCIIFTDENDVDLALREVTRAESFVFNLEDRSVHKLESNQMFWPPQAELGSSSTSKCL